jgi:RHS repeat-associated protein
MIFRNNYIDEALIYFDTTNYGTKRKFDYTAFGEQMGLITNDGGADDVKDGVSFQGSYFDSESNLYYARARYLMPEQGRWLTRDSFEDYSPAGLNKYQDCNNNPVRFTDPLGLYDEPYVGSSGEESSSTVYVYDLSALGGRYSGGNGNNTTTTAQPTFDEQKIIDAANRAKLLSDALQNNDHLSNVDNAINTPLTWETDKQVKENIEKNDFVVENGPPKDSFNDKFTTPKDGNPWNPAINPDNYIQYEQDKYYIDKSQGLRTDILQLQTDKAYGDMNILDLEDADQQIKDKDKQLEDMQQTWMEYHGISVSNFNYNPTKGTLTTNVTDNPELAQEMYAGQVLHYNLEMAQYGDSIDSKVQNSGNFVVLGDQGRGLGTIAGKDVYDDRITVIKRNTDGSLTMREFNQANLESTNSENQKYSSIAGGKYSLSVYKWDAQPNDLRKFTLAVNPGGLVPTEDGQVNKNPEFANLGAFMNQVLIHVGGADSDWSHGCNSIYGGSTPGVNGVEGDYGQFREMFRSYNQQNQSWSYDYGKSSTYYLNR